MSEPIKVGDLAVLVKPCPKCGTDTDLGNIFTVRWIGVSLGITGNLCCGYGKGLGEIVVNDELIQGQGWTLPRVKRIPPLSELEGERTQEKLHDPMPAWKRAILGKEPA